MVCPVRLYVASEERCFDSIRQRDIFSQQQGSVSVNGTDVLYEKKKRSRPSIADQKECNLQTYNSRQIGVLRISHPNGFFYINTEIPYTKCKWLCRLSYQLCEWSDKLIVSYYQIKRKLSIFLLQN